jgi:hypothetical protein
MQTKIIAGDSFYDKTTHADYSAADGWVQKMRLTHRNAGTAIVLTAAAEGEYFVTEALPSTTANWVPGAYSYAVWVERTNERKTLDNGEIQILPDPSTMAAGTDTRSHVARTVEILQAALEGNTTKGVLEYKIADREIKYIQLTELRTLLDKYEHLLAAETRAQSRSKNFGRKINMRF